MSDLLRSALGYFNNPGAGPGGGGPGQGSQGDHHHGHGGGGFSSGGGGGSDETSAVGDVISFQCDNSQKRSVRIQKQIAEGGFSYVYRGVDATSGEVVALKKMIAPDPEALKAIEQEVEFLRQFQHDNIIKFYGSVMRPSGRLKEYFIAMEYCPVQLPTPPLRQQHATQVFGQTCKAIKYLHDFGIVHRDIKIENVLIGLDGLVKLVDFGSATMEKIYPQPDWPMNKRTIIEESIAQKTTPMYRAPEMLDLWSNHPIDEHSDMWALGCLLFALNFGQHPFQDSNKLAITNANYNLPKNASNANPMVVIIRGLLKVNPLERISFGQIFELLQSIAECEGFSVNGKLPFKPAVSPVTVVGPSPVAPPAPPSHSQPPHHHHHSASHGSSSSSGGGGGGGGGGLFSSVKGLGSNLIKNLKEQSQQIIYGGPGVESVGAQQQPPSRPPPPGGHRAPGPPARPAAPPPKSQHLEFENREYEIMQQSQNQQHPPPHRPAPPKPPPPRVSPVPPEPVQETVGNLLDISLEPPQTFAEAKPTESGGKNDLLDDLFGFGSSSTAGSVPQTNNNAVPSFADDLLWGTATDNSNGSGGGGGGSKKSEFNLLGDTKDPFADLLGKSAPTTSIPSSTTTFQQTQPSFGFGIPPGAGGGARGPTPMQPAMGTMPTSASFQNLTYSAINPQAQQNSGGGGGGGMDLLGPSTGKGGSASIPKNSSTPNLLSDLLMGDLMGNTGKMNIGGGPSAAATNTTNKSNPTINQFGGGGGNGGGPQGKPNYNRHQIFDPPANANPQEKKQNLNDAFGDILSSQGFASTGGGQQTKTINDLRKIEMLQNPNIDPIQMKVNEWREGKKKNIRALLASLHTITWEECNWEETNMSQMITPAQVKKTYRKACLAIHPDKQMGKDWEQLAKLLFVELNEAWAAFEESQS